jgi:leader peptidase (prepilin peptidase)/N-methyltransferase
MEQLLLYLFLFLLGTVFGSFANVLIYRFSEKENIKEILFKRSYCPHCKTPIKWYDNIPLISYLVLRGRCRHCGAPISIRYPIVEFLSGLLLVLSWILFSDYGLPSVVAFYTFSLLSLVLALIDWKTFEVPDTLTIGGTVFGLFLSFFRTNITPEESFIAALFGFLFVIAISFIYYALRKIIPLGLGDAKYLAMVGAFGGFTTLYCSVFLGSLFGLLFFLPQIVRNKSLQFAVPFVPFLALGAILGLICRGMGLNIF